MKKYDTLIYGYYGQENVGDDYIMASVIKSVLKSSASKRIGVFVVKNVFQECGFPKSVEFLEMPKNKILRQIYIVKHIMKSKKFIIGGGGLWTNDALGKIIINNVWISMAKIFNTDVCLYGIELTNIRNKKAKYLWKKLIAKVDWINTRTSASYNMLVKMAREENSNKIEFSPDVTFAISDLEVKQIQNSNYICEEEYVLWALAMPWNIDEMENVHYGERYCKFINDLYKIYEEIKKEYPKSVQVFIPFLKNRDDIVIRDLVSKGVTNFEIYEGGVYNIREIFAHAQLAVCMRFHSVIFSLYEHCRFVAISYSPKTTNTLKENNITGYVEFGIRDSGYFYKEFDLDVDKIKKCIKLPMLNPIDNCNSLVENAKRAEGLLITWLNN